MRIEVKNISYIYSKGLPYETRALDDISFTAEPGDFIAFIGCTGSGKTTLAEHVCGLLEPSEGSVLADGIEISAKTAQSKALRRKIGLVFQYPEYQLFEETVIKDVMFGPKNLGQTPEECLENSRHALTLVGLNPDAVSEISPFSLSGGQKRRVAIAGVLAMNPEVLILDEPTAGLDPKGRTEILEMIRKIKQERNLTVFLVSHNMDDVAELANKVLVLKRGKLQMLGSPAEVFADSEKLLASGMDLPSAAGFLHVLKERGMDIDDGKLYIDEAAQEILKKWH